ncbi:MAG: CpsD/CapB family tyrosine-protein kinase [Blautia sp.]|nr:CpsD/CapB family tyrosine-protein kinase [Blautia sp.]
MKRLKIEKMPEVPYAMEEAFNRLRIGISFLGRDVRKIMIVSSLPNEGKSFVTFQMWKQMAETGVPSVLLDMDLRKSVMADKYHMSGAFKEKLSGMSHFLAGDNTVEEALYHTEIPSGDILPNVDNVISPSLLIEGPRMKELLNECAKRYRYVFVDVPPLGLVSDAEKIGSVCDGAILVVRANSTSKNIVRNSIAQLERAGCPVLGTVLNRVETNHGGYYYKKHAGYGYYGNEYYQDSKEG